MNLKEKIEKNSLAYFFGAVIISFMAGFSTFKVIVEIAQLDLLQKGSYVKKEDCDSLKSIAILPPTILPQGEVFPILNGQITLSVGEMHPGLDLAAITIKYPDNTSKIFSMTYGDRKVFKYLNDKYIIDILDVIMKGDPYKMQYLDSEVKLSVHKFIK